MAVGGLRTMVPYTLVNPQSHAEYCKAKQSYGVSGSYAQLVAFSSVLSRRR
jgi:hypothetical protein